MDWERINKIIENEKERYYVEQDFRQFTTCYKQILEDDETMLSNDMLVQMTRSSIQEMLDKDPLVYSDEEKELIKTADKFILEHIEDANRWFYPERKSPLHYWWNHLDLILSGRMKKPKI